VLIGASGAHGLAAELSPSALSTWDTAVFYQLVHALALLLVGVLVDGDLRSRASTRSRASARSRALRLAGFSFVTGILLFSGSLYVLALSGPTVLGPVTPLGGMAFIVGWSALAASTFFSQPASEPPGEK